jgi:hypothetical protein
LSLEKQVCSDPRTAALASQGGGSWGVQVTSWRKTREATAEERQVCFSQNLHL